MKKQNKIIILLFILILSAFDVIRAQERFSIESGTYKTIAVMNFVNRGNDWVWLSKGLADMLITDLSKSNSLQVLERERMQNFIDELILHKSGMIDETTAKGFGKFVKVDWVLYGSFEKKDDQIQIESHIVNIATGELLRVEWVKGNANDIFTLEKELVFKIINNLQINITDQEKESIKYLPTDSIDAATHYYNGIDYFDKGKYKEAFLEFKLAKTNDKNYYKAVYWVGKMYYYLGEYDHAIEENSGILEKFGALDKEKMFIISIEMGKIGELNIKYYDKAINYYKQAINTFNLIYTKEEIEKYKKEVGIDKLGSIDTNLHREKNISSDMNKKWQIIGNLYWKIADMCVKMKQYKEAIINYKNSLEHFYYKIYPYFDILTNLKDAEAKLNVENENLQENKWPKKSKDRANYLNQQVTPFSESNINWSEPIVISKTDGYSIENLRFTRNSGNIIAYWSKKKVNYNEIINIAWCREDDLENWNYPNTKKMESIFDSFPMLVYKNSESDYCMLFAKGCYVTRSWDVHSEDKGGLFISKSRDLNNWGYPVSIEKESFNSKIYFDIVSNWRYVDVIDNDLFYYTGPEKYYFYVYYFDRLKMDKDKYIISNLKHNDSYGHSIGRGKLVKDKKGIYWAIWSAGTSEKTGERRSRDIESHVNISSSKDGKTWTDPVNIFSSYLKDGKYPRSYENLRMICSSNNEFFIYYSNYYSGVEMCYSKDGKNWSGVEKISDSEVGNVIYMDKDDLGRFLLIYKADGNIILRHTDNVMKVFQTGKQKE
ncbi:MAG: CsgG/HfaB family protein [Candidatus Firestonebacteria bacterium]